MLIEDIKIRKITQTTQENINKMTNWMYEWWAKDEGITYEQVKSFIEHMIKYQTRED